MDIGYLTSDAAKYPLNNWKKLIILGILFLISFLIVPAFLAMGYLFKTLKCSIAGVDELPNFDGLGELLLDGFKVFMVQLVYFIIPSIIILAGIIISLNSIPTIQNIGESTVLPVAFSLMGGLIILGSALSVIFSVFFTIALANMAFYEEFSAAFRFGELLNMIKAIGWVDFIIWYVMMMIIGGLVGFIATMLLFIPIIGWALIILVILPYLYILYARALGLLFVSGFENQ
jgi:hypothetical protein